MDKVGCELYKTRCSFLPVGLRLPLLVFVGNNATISLQERESLTASEATRKARQELEEQENAERLALVGAAALEKPSFGVSLNPYMHPYLK